MKILILIICSFNLLAQTGEQQSVFDPKLSSSYKESECYKEYNGVYQKSVQSSMNQLQFKQNLAFSTGIVLNSSNSNSDWGKAERSIANAADYKSDSNSSYSLNDFHIIYTKAQKKYPSITKDQTQTLIRKGFQSGKFCDHWLFSSRYSTNQVSRYVKKEFEKHLEQTTNREPAIDDSSMSELELEDSMNNELQYNDDSSKALEN